MILHFARVKKGNDEVENGFSKKPFYRKIDRENVLRKMQVSSEETDIWDCKDN